MQNKSGLKFPTYMFKFDKDGLFNKAYISTII